MKFIVNRKHSSANTSISILHLLVEIHFSELFQIPCVNSIKRNDINSIYILYTFRITAKILNITRITSTKLLWHSLVL